MPGEHQPPGEKGAVMLASIYIDGYFLTCCRRLLFCQNSNFCDYRGYAQDDKYTSKQSLFGSSATHTDEQQETIWQS